MSLFREAREAIFDALDYAVTAESGDSFNKAPDNTTNLQIVIDAAINHGGGTIVLPPGRIPLDGTVTIKNTDGIYIQGSGLDVTTIEKDPATKDSSPSLFRVENVDGFKASDFSINSNSVFDNAEPFWDSIRLLGTTKRVVIDSIHKYDGDPPPIILEEHVEDFRVSNIYTNNVHKGPVSTFTVKNGTFTNIYDINSQQGFDLGNDGSGTRSNENLWINSVHIERTLSMTADAQEAAFDLANMKNVFITNCTCTNYYDGFKVKTEGGGSETITDRAVFRNCEANVHNRAYEVLLFDEDENNTSVQGPVSFYECRGIVNSNAGSPEAFLTYSVSQIDDIDSKGIVVENCKSEGFPYFLRPRGVVKNVTIENCEATELKSVVDIVNETIQGNPDNWHIRNFTGDAGFHLDRNVLDINISGLYLTAGANNTEAYGLRIEDTLGFKMSGFRLEGFDDGGVRLNYFQGTIDPDNHLDTVVRNGEIRDCAQATNVDFPAGVWVDFSGEGSSGESAKGIFIDGIRVYSTSEDNMATILHVEKGNFDDIDASILTNNIGAGISANAINGNPDLGSNTYSEGNVVV